MAITAAPPAAPLELLAVALFHTAMQLDFEDVLAGT